MPGRVMVKEFMLGRKPDTAAKQMPIWPARVMTATTPGRRKTTTISRAMRMKAMTPAISMDSRAWPPRVGARELKLEVVRAKGSAPAWICAARVVALSLVKLPSITHLPSLITALTVGAERRTSSIQMEMVWPTSRSVASANFCLPSSLNSSETTYWAAPVVWSWFTAGSAFTTSDPSKIIVSAVVPVGVL